ncbi:MAG TPA: hypothetical protein VM223_07155 [Planctomycetota bacterium]|nr:hypothetical protein [Planctomycetota bacterium]
MSHDERTTAHVKACETALKNIAAAAQAGKPVSLADAKALEAAGCWLRRNAVNPK